MLRRSKSIFDSKNSSSSLEVYSPTRCVEKDSNFLNAGNSFISVAKICLGQGFDVQKSLLMFHSKRLRYALANHATFWNLIDRVDIVNMELSSAKFRFLCLFLLYSYADHCINSTFLSVFWRRYQAALEQSVLHRKMFDFVRFIIGLKTILWPK